MCDVKPPYDHTNSHKHGERAEVQMELHAAQQDMPGCADTSCSKLDSQTPENNQQIDRLAAELSNVKSNWRHAVSSEANAQTHAEDLQVQLQEARTYAVQLQFQFQAQCKEAS